MMKTWFLAASLIAGVAGAQTLTGIKVEPAQAQVGQPVNVTLSLEYKGSPNCGIKVRWGDGAVTEKKLNSEGEIPFKTSHAYAKAGDYSIVADPGKVGGSFGCVGKNLTAVVKVAAPPPPPAPAAAASGAKPVAAAGPACPDGWKLDPKSVNKKSGAYVCTAKAGTPLPEKRPACPGDLSYFENSRRGQLGCRS